MGNTFIDATAVVTPTDPSIAKLLVMLPDASPAALALMLADATAELLSLTHLTVLPVTAEPLLRKMVIVAYNRQGAEGLSGTGASGASDSFIDGYGDDIKRAIYALRKVQK